MTPRILDGLFYSILVQKGDNVEARCNDCNEVKKGNINSTGNFLSHFKKKHAERLDKLNEHLHGGRDISSEASNRQPSVLEIFQSKNNSQDVILHELIQYCLLSVTIATDCGITD